MDHSAHIAMPDRSIRLTSRLIALAVVPALLIAIDFWQARLLWMNLYWMICAGGAFGLSLYRFPSRAGTRRRIRIALSACLGSYFLAQLFWSSSVLARWEDIPGWFDLLFLFAPLPLIWAALIAVRKRQVDDSRVTAYLDALTVVLAVVVVTLAVFGTTTQGLDEAILLLYPALYLSAVGAIAVAVLATDGIPRWNGSWMVLLGAFVLGCGITVWASRSLSSEVPVGVAFDYLYGIGSVLLGFGAATWGTDTTMGPDRRRWMDKLSDLLPLSAIVVAIGVALVIRPSPQIAPIVWILVVGMLVVNGLRQVLLIQSQRSSQTSLRKLAVELTSAEERERRKFATFLHDDVGQAIALLNIKIRLFRGTKEPKERVQLLSEIDELLMQTAKITQSTTFDVSPTILSDLGLMPAVRDLAATFRETFSSKITVFGDGLVRSIGKDTELMLYRFIKELLTNRMKHADATDINVCIDEVKNGARVVIVDNGRIFDVAEKNAGGFGLYSVRERISAVGGQFTIRSAPGGETSTRIVVPTLVTTN